MPKPTDAARQRAAQGLPPVIRRRLGDITQDIRFDYAVNFVYTVGTEALTLSIPIQSDAHFLCVESTYDVSLTAVPAYALASLAVTPQLGFGGCLVQITDGATQRAMQNIPVAASTIFGTAQRPFVWPLQHIFKANTPIIVASTGVSAALMALTTVRYVFSGFKIPVGTLPELNL